MSDPVSTNLRAAAIGQLYRLDLGKHRTHAASQAGLPDTTRPPLVGVDGHPELHQLAVHAGQQGRHRVVRVLHGDPGDLLRLEPEVPEPSQPSCGLALLSELGR
jgi:hypothetical protein